jgi:hypothetical protein
LRDAKPQIQALDRTPPLLPMQPGQIERRTHDYKRHGITTLFAALNAKTSEVITQFHQRHRSAQFREFLDLIDAQVPRLDVHVIIELTMNQIRGGASRSVTQPKAGIQAFIDAHQADPKPSAWSADEILARIARFAQRTVDARAALTMSRTIGTGH